MDLFKTFDCSPNDLLVTKPYSYGLKEDAVTFAYSSLKRKKQDVKINDTESLLKYFYWVW